MILIYLIANAFTNKRYFCSFKMLLSVHLNLVTKFFFWSWLFLLKKSTLKHFSVLTLLFSFPINDHRCKANNENDCRCNYIQVSLNWKTNFIQFPEIILNCSCFIYHLYYFFFFKYLSIGYYFLDIVGARKHQYVKWYILYY